MKITVLTPTYNRANYIKETVESVLSQTHQDYEYIVLDDGSTDATREVLEPYKTRLRYIYHANMGETKTVNKGYSLATGEAVVVVNSDDPFLRDDALALLSEALERNPGGLAAYPDYIYINEHSVELSRQEQIDFTFRNMLETFNITIGPGMCIRRSALERIGYRNECLRYTGDVDVSLRLAALGQLVHVKEFLASHRIHSGSISVSGKNEFMAYEITRLMQLGIVNPAVADFSHAKKMKLLGTAHEAATHYCAEGTPEFEFHRYFSKALLFRL